MLCSVHRAFDVTPTRLVFAAADGFHASPVRKSVAPCGAWVTDIVLVGAPRAVTVIVPDLDVVFGFAVALSLKDPLPEPVVGVAVSHEVALLLTVQFLLDVTLIVACDAADDGCQEPVDKLSVASPAG